MDPISNALTMAHEEEASNISGTIQSDGDFGFEYLT